VPDLITLAKRHLELVSEELSGFRASREEAAAAAALNPLIGSTPGARPSGATPPGICCMRSVLLSLPATPLPALRAAGDKPWPLRAALAATLISNLAPLQARRLRQRERAQRRAAAAAR
jgi:hypothetical protein